MGSGQKEVSVRIDSSVVAMESTRKYSSVTVRSARGSMVRRTGNLNRDPGNLGGFFDSLDSTGENTEQT